VSGWLETEAQAQNIKFFNIEYSATYVFQVYKYLHCVCIYRKSIQELLTKLKLIMFI